MTAPQLSFELSVSWLESKTLGDQVAVAFDQFGNDNYKVSETLETENSRLGEVNYQLTGCSESQSLHGNLEGHSSFLQPDDRLKIKTRT